MDDVQVDIDSCFTLNEEMLANVTEVAFNPARLPRVEKLYARALGRLVRQRPNEYAVLAACLEGSGIDPCAGRRYNYLEPAFVRLPEIPRLFNKDAPDEEERRTEFLKFQENRYQWLSGVADRS